MTIDDNLFWDIRNHLMDMDTYHSIEKRIGIPDNSKQFEEFLGEYIKADRRDFNEEERCKYMISHPHIQTYEELVHRAYEQFPEMSFADKLQQDYHIVIASIGFKKGERVFSFASENEIQKPKTETRSQSQKSEMSKMVQYLNEHLIRHGRKKNNELDEITIYADEKWNDPCLTIVCNHSADSQSQGGNRGLLEVSGPAVIQKFGVETKGNLYAEEVIPVVEAQNISVIRPYKRSRSKSQSKERNSVRQDMRNKQKNQNYQTRHKVNIQKENVR